MTAEENGPGDFEPVPRVFYAFAAQDIKALVGEVDRLRAALLPEPPEPASPAVVAMNALCQRPPWEFYGVYDNERCFFCGRDRSSNRDLSLDEEGQHEVDCAWWLWRQTAAHPAVPEAPR